MPSSAFHSDDDWQRGVRDAVLVPGFYRQRATEGRYVLLDKGRLSSILQRRSAVDTVVQGSHGNAVFVEEKITRWPSHKGVPWSNFFLETESCTNPGRESEGWMHYGEADLLLYCFCVDEKQDVLDAYLINFLQLKKWFWSELKARCERGSWHHRPARGGNTSNGTWGYTVPICDVRAGVGLRRYGISSDGFLLVRSSLLPLSSAIEEDERDANATATSAA